MNRASTSALADHTALVAGLRTLLGADTVIETHISTVLLAGGFAYKLKKPLALGFLDFTTLAAREFYCREELRVNRRTAPAIYLDVVAIGGTAQSPSLHRAGPAIDYMVRMRRFPDDARLDRLAARAGLSGDLADRLALAVAGLHALPSDGAAPVQAGTPHEVIERARDNFRSMGAERGRLARLADWTETAFERRTHQFAARRAGGFVREGHGDLHLANIALIDGAPVLFDAIEFNPLLRWIDVMNDAAFLFMDLLDHGLDRAAWRFLNRYVESTGDHRGLATLDFYVVYRALVRAKINLIRADQPHADRAAARAGFTHYVELAERIARGRPPLVVAMHGLAGSGKSTLAGELAERLGAIRIRSDVERKRMHGLHADARSGVSDRLYTASANATTYAELARLAELTLDAGQPVIIDATCLRRADRDLLRRTAHAAGARFAIIECRAAEATLRERVAARAARGGDPSEADLAVLELQLRTIEPLGPDERPATLTVATDRPQAASAEAIARELGATR